jgi:hypothetical protein
LLAEPFLGPDSITAGTDWVIKHDRYFLPADCVEILDVGFRERNVVGAQNVGKIEAVPARMDLDLGLSVQRTAGKPSCYIPLPEFFAVGPENGDFQSILTLFTVTATNITPGSGGTWPTGSFYFGVSYVYGGPDQEHLMPESDILWSTEPLLLNGINMSVEVLVNNSTANPLEGVWFKPYVGVDNGCGQLVAWELVYPQGPTPYAPLYFDFNVNFPWASEDGIWMDGDVLLSGQTKVRPRTMHTSKSIRFFPRPQVIDQTVTYDEDIVWRRGNFDLRYIYQPAPLILNSDTINMPEEFSHLIIDRVLVDLYLHLNNPSAAQLHQRKYDERMKILTARYASEKDVSCIRRSSWHKTSPGGLGTINPVTFRGPFWYPPYN